MTEGIFETAIECVSRADTLDDMSKLMFELRDMYGLAHIVYHAVSVPAVPASNPMLLLTYDQQWVSRYTARDYFKIDPVVAGGRAGFLPLDWSDVDHDSFVARRFFQEADRFGVGRNGMSLPIRGPNGERAILSLTSNASTADWQKFRLARIRDFQLLAHHVHDRAMLIGGFRSSVIPSLSVIEKECLQLAARGLAPKRIALAAGLSETTARFYLRGAQYKLGCISLGSSIAKAINMELIEAVR